VEARMQKHRRAHQGHYASIQNKKERKFEPKQMNYYYSGTLPAMIWRNEVWCLLAAELDGKLSAFGGGPEAGETRIQTAARETFEESGGILKEADVTRAIESCSLALNNGEGAVQYVVRVKHANLAHRIQKALGKCISRWARNGDPLPESHCEKTFCVWVPLISIWHDKSLRQKLRGAFRSNMDALGETIYQDVDQALRAAAIGL